MKRKALIIAMGIILTLSGTAAAIKCGNTFIETGVTSIEVIAACGEPLAKEVVKEGGRSGKTTERWTYGPYKGNYYFLYFKAGKLEKLESKKK